MKKHPVYAFELLSSIQYLNPALDIPIAITNGGMALGTPGGFLKRVSPRLPVSLPWRMFGMLYRQIAHTRMHGLKPKQPTTSKNYLAHSLTPR